MIVKKSSYWPLQRSNLLSMSLSKQISSKISYFNRILFELRTITPFDSRIDTILVSNSSANTPEEKRFARSSTIYSMV